MKEMKFSVPCLFGLEGICAQELKHLDIPNVQAENWPWGHTCLWALLLRFSTATL